MKKFIIGVILIVAASNLSFVYWLSHREADYTIEIKHGLVKVYSSTGLVGEGDISDIPQIITNDNL